MSWFFSSSRTFCRNMGAAFLACISSLWVCPNPNKCFSATAIVVLPGNAIGAMSTFHSSVHNSRRTATWDRDGQYDCFSEIFLVCVRYLFGNGHVGFFVGFHPLQKA